MRKSKLFTLLSLLSEEEYKRFGRFIRSPYYGYNPHLSPLYKYISKYFPNLDSTKLNRELVFKKIFVGEAFDWNKLRKLMSALTQLTEEFLIVLELEKTPFQKRKWLAQALSNRGEFVMFDKETKHLLHKLEERPHRDINYFQERTDLLSRRYFHPEYKRYDKEDLTMQELTESLDSYFGLAKMRYGLEIKNRNKLFSINIEERFILALKQETQNGLLSKIPIFKIYSLLHSAISSQEEEEILAFEKDFFQNSMYLPRIDAQVIFFNGLNFFIRKLNQGSVNYYRKILNWYKLGLDRDLIIEKNIISETTYANIVVIACKEKEFNWADDFIEEYQSFLHPEIQEDVFLLNKCILSFYQDKFEEITFFISSHSFSPRFLPKIRLLEIQAIFGQYLTDSSYFEVLIAKIKAFDIFIKRTNVLSSESSKPYHKSIKLIESVANKLIKKEKKEAIILWLNDKGRNKDSNIKNWILEMLSWIG